MNAVRNVSAAVSAPPPTIWASAWRWLFWALWVVWLAVSDLRNSEVRPVMTKRPRALARGRFVW